VASGCGALGAASASGEVPGAGGAAVVVTVALLGAHLTPGLAARLAGLPRPPVPSQPAEVREQPPPPNAQDLRRRTAIMDSYLTALTAAGAVVTVAGAAVVSTGRSWAAVTLVAIAGAALALRARHLGSAPARGWLLGGAAATGAVFVASYARGTGIALGLLLLCLLATVLSGQMPHRRVSPRWGRAGDLGEVLAVVAAVPVALQVLDVYSVVRAIGG
jgi:type VII secretion integral membrane protein EccD